MSDREHDTETESYREERGRPADSAGGTRPAGPTLGGMLRGPVGREGAPADGGEETSAEADERAARERDTSDG